ncbi:DUF1217 domain-containing protein [Roseovarius pelagicus]|uniref:DUF1217 domain-containing protein n=1 Tax=Roseovarius pelagicus TaxID=2980108 RepID=A0ABY6D9M2_9RHOB|nr:DUF1217 domain-containing protein [Roseovarius pelagicus]UXX82290.1 DUF1217 domain-containing protein [Roseovarius pelagicus]
MSYQPVVPLDGLAGWAFLTRTLATQTAAFDSGARISRDTTYFEQAISDVETAEQLVSDRRLLRVALGAFGLQDDLDNRFFIRKILEGGTEADDALATRLADSRYREFADAFGFGNLGGRRTFFEGFGREITEKFRARQFEIAVGDQDQSMRLAMTAERSLPDIATGTGSDKTKWLRIMGDPPLREVFERALGLPEGFGQMDLDRQVEVFRDRASRQLGIDTLDQLADADTRKHIIERYLIRNQVAEFTAQSGTSIALTLLQS